MTKCKLDIVEDPLICQPFLGKYIFFSSDFSQLSKPVTLPVYLCVRSKRKRIMEYWEFYNSSSDNDSDDSEDYRA